MTFRLINYNHFWGVFLKCGTTNQGHQAQPSKWNGDWNGARRGQYSSQRVFPYFILPILGRVTTHLLYLLDTLHSITVWSTAYCKSSSKVKLWSIFSTENESLPPSCSSSSALASCLSTWICNTAAGKWQKKNQDYCHIRVATSSQPSHNNLVIIRRMQ